MNRKVIVIGSSVLVIILSVLYINLGGFEPPKLRLSTSNDFYVLGKTHKGLVSDKELQKLMDEVAQL